MVAQTRDIVVNETRQEFLAGFHHVWGLQVEIVVGNTSNPEIQTYTVSGDNYIELFAASPSWGIGKPEGVFRIDDLWVMVDRLRQ